MQGGEWLFAFLGLLLLLFLVLFLFVCLFVFPSLSSRETLKYTQNHASMAVSSWGRMLREGKAEFSSWSFGFTTPPGLQDTTPFSYKSLSTSNHFPLPSQSPQVAPSWLSSEQPITELSSSPLHPSSLAQVVK